MWYPSSDLTLRNIWCVGYHVSLLQASRPATANRNSSDQTCCLQVLCLTDSAAGLLSRLRLPALQYLMLLFHERAILPPISEETTPALTELALLSLLSDDVVDGRALADILKWTPNLTSMTFLGKGHLNDQYSLHRPWKIQRGRFRVGPTPENDFPPRRSIRVSRPWSCYC